MTEPVGAAVRTRGLWKRYAGRDALKGVELTIPQGECHAVLGSNGAGKTTLMRILATLARPTEGELVVNGLDLPAHANEVRSRLGVVLDHHLLHRDFPLAEALAYYAALYRVPDAAERVARILHDLDLGRRARDPVRTLSRGMAQRASLARALLHDPEILLLDEPFTALDTASCGLVETAIAEMVRRGRTVLLATHDLARARALAPHATLLRDGRVTFRGPTDEATRALEAPGEGP